MEVVPFGLSITPSAKRKKIVIFSICFFFSGAVNTCPKNYCGLAPFSSLKALRMETPPMHNLWDLQSGPDMLLTNDIFFSGFGINRLFIH